MSTLIPGDLVRVSTSSDDGKGEPTPGQPKTRPAATPTTTACR
jgi:hypothetical protein